MTTQTTQWNVVALGEYLIDFTGSGVSAQGNGLFEANPGGAPCNVLSMLNRLGRRCAFVGKVGDDLFGSLLRRTGEEAGICMDALLVDKKARTTLAFVETKPDGDRAFSFFRNPGADMQLQADELPMDMLKATNIFHYGSISMTHEPARTATMAAYTAARASGALVTYDPNLRPLLWDDLHDAKAQIEWGLSHTDYAKIADDELAFLLGDFPETAADFDRGALAIQKTHPNLRLLTITAGAGGSYGYTDDMRLYEPALQLGGTIETTGAGDAFCGCILDGLLTHGLDMTKDELREMLHFAAAAAYLVTTKKGAIKSMPTREQVEAVLG